jgi:hypothetical protein
VSGIVSPLVSDHVIRKLRKDVYNLSLAFVAPLGADNRDVGHAISLYLFLVKKLKAGVNISGL